MTFRLHARPRRAAAVGLLAAGGLTLAPASAGAWERPAVLSPPTASVDGPYLATDDRGDALLAWARGVPSSEEWGLPVSSWVEAVRRPAGAPGWSAVQRLSPAGELAIRPLAVLPPSGAGAVWWTRLQRGVLDITGAESVDADGWSFRSLDMEAGVWTVRASATAPDGTLAVAELDPWKERPDLRVRVRTPEGAWRESAPIAALDPNVLEVGLSSDGTVLVASLEGDGEWGMPGATTRLVTVAWSPATGAWGAPERSADIRGAGAGLRLAALPDGTMVAAVVLRRDEGFALVATSRPPGGAFGTPQVLGGDVDPSAEMAASPAGDVVVAWTADGEPRLSVRRDDGGWSRPETAPPGVCLQPQSVAAVAAGPSGEALLVAMAGYADDWHPGMVRAWVRRPDGAWTGPVWLSGPFAGGPAAAIDGAGRMHVAWTRQGKRLPVVETTSTTPADAALSAVPQDPVAVVSRLRVSSRGRARTVRFRLSRPARVTISARPLARREDAPSVEHEDRRATRRERRPHPPAPGQVDRHGPAHPGLHRRVPGDLDALPRAMRRAPRHRRLARAAMTIALGAAAVPGVATADGSLADGYVGLGDRMGDRPALPSVMPRPIAFPARAAAAEYPLRGPTEVRIVRGGVLIVGESMTGRVLRVGTGGRVSVLPGRRADDLALCGGSRAGDVAADPFVNKVFRGSTSIAGTGRTGFAGDGGPATAARLNDPTCAAPAADGGILVADQGNNRVRRIAPDGTITTIAGNGETGFSGEGGPATAAGMVPHAVVALPDGGALVTDPRNARVLRIHQDGTLSTFAGTGTPGYDGDGGPARQARLTIPWGIARGADGSVVVADFGSQTVRRISPQGVITTVLGAQPQQVAAPSRARTAWVPARRLVSHWIDPRPGMTSWGERGTSDESASGRHAVIRSEGYGGGLAGMTVVHGRLRWDYGGDDAPCWYSDRTRTGRPATGYRPGTSRPGPMHRRRTRPDLARTPRTWCAAA